MSVGLPHPLRALRSRDFRIYFIGQLISVAGTWMQQIAMAWLAYRLTDSALAPGLLVSSAGAGALSASLLLAPRASVVGLARKVSIAASTAGVALALFSLNRNHALAYPILMVLGFSMVLTAVGSNTLLQSWVRDDMRGRVMATFSMAFLGVAPLGSLAVGSLAHGFGIRPTLALCGALTVVVGLLHGRWLRLRMAAGNARPPVPWPPPGPPGYYPLNSAWRKQSTTWSFTIPTPCMKA